MGFQSHFSDDSAQNAATTSNYMKTFIHWMYDNNLFIKDGIIYDTTDVCNKQYICSDAMRILSELVFIYRVIIDICINIPVRGRNKIYGTNGADNTYLKQKGA